MARRGWVWVCVGAGFDFTVVSLGQGKWLANVIQPEEEPGQQID